MTEVEAESSCDVEGDEDGDEDDDDDELFLTRRMRLARTGTEERGSLGVKGRDGLAREGIGGVDVKEDDDVEEEASSGLDDATEWKSEDVEED